MEIRKAKKDDKGAIAEMIYSSGGDLYDFIYKTKNTSSLDYIRHEFKSGRGFCGYTNVTVAVQEGEVIATGCFYDGKSYNKLVLGTVLNCIQFYGIFKVGAIISRSLHVTSVMTQPRPTELYLSNFGVSEKHRSKGIGSTIINQKIAEARQLGYAKFSLDVAANNPNAEALYKRLGLTIVKTKTFTGIRAGYDIGQAKKMEVVLR
jgi:ribosomal protein S18 acetylase RimI-like enzyme